MTILGMKHLFTLYTNFEKIQTALFLTPKPTFYLSQTTDPFSFLYNVSRCHLYQTRNHTRGPFPTFQPELVVH